MISACLVPAAVVEAVLGLVSPGLLQVRNFGKALLLLLLRKTDRKQALKLLEKPENRKRPHSLMVYENSGQGKAGQAQLVRGGCSSKDLLGLIGC